MSELPAGLEARNAEGNKYRKTYEFLVRPCRPLPLLALLPPALPPRISAPAAAAAQKKHPYKLREVMSMRNILRGTGLTIGSSAVLFYAIAISVQLRRKARPPFSRSDVMRDS